MKTQEFRKEGSNRLTFYTLRWIYDSGRGNEFEQCTSPTDIKRLLWKYMAPFYQNSSRKISNYKNVRKVMVNTVDTIDRDKPLYRIEADEVYDVTEKDEALKKFKKGVLFIRFDELYSWLKEKKSPSLLKIIQMLYIKSKQSKDDFEVWMGEEEKRRKEEVQQSQGDIQ